MEDILLAEDVLRGLLTEPYSHSLTTFTDAYARLQDATARRVFKEGFCLAYKLASEVSEHLGRSESNLKNP